MDQLWAGDPSHGEDTRASGAVRPGARADGQLDTVLVVDDDTSILDTVSAILSGEGYDVISAASGEEALEAVARRQPAVILLDMRMPVMDGWAVARALHTQGSTVPIVVMTAAENAKRWAEEVGADGFLAKPFGLDELLAAIERFRSPDAPAN
jgi:CheY-like chemotaxis protein